MMASSVSSGAWLLGMFMSFIAYKLVKLVYHVNAARNTGLPYTVAPALETEVFGKLLAPFVRKLFAKRLLRGDGWPQWIRFSILDWAWEDKGRAHQEYGEVFLVVSPEGIICYSADADMGWDVMNRRAEFIKPRDKMKVIEPYGPNVATTEGKEFQFHLRITAPSFGDATGINDLVWAETVSQTRTMMHSLADGAAHDMVPFTKRLTLSVIALTGFGRRLDFQANTSHSHTSIPDGYKMSLDKALSEVSENVIPILILPKWFMRLAGMGEIAVAHEQLDKYMRDMVQDEMRLLEQKQDDSSAWKGNMLTSIVHASAKDAIGTGRKQAFTEDEVLGNVFVMLLAGHETTAHSLIYALVSLALKQDVQDKVIIEVDSIHAEAAAEGRADLTYADDFKKLEYTYGFMYEILRLYPALSVVSKTLTNKPATITVFPRDQPSRQHILPADCRVYLNTDAVHYSERYWPHAAELKPERWITAVGMSHGGERYERDDKKVAAADKARQVKGTMQTFSGGGRACIGRRFAQSEIVATLATLLREYRIELGKGLNPTAVQNEINRLSVGGLTLGPQRPIPLVLKKRRSS